MDHWYAECVPCKWQETHDNQPDALVAAEQHVIDVHRDLFSLPTDERGRKMAELKIGHVQLRSEDTIGTGMSQGAASLEGSGVELPVSEQIAAEEKNVGEALDALALLKAKLREQQKAGA